MWTESYYLFLASQLSRDPSTSTSYKVRDFKKTMDKNCAPFNYLKEKFPSIREDQRRTFEGPVATALIGDETFRNRLRQVENSVQSLFKSVTVHTFAWEIIIPRTTTRL